MPESAAIIQKREELYAKLKDLGEIFDLAKDGDRFDFGRKTVMERIGAVDANDAFEKVRTRRIELDDLGAKLREDVALDIYRGVEDVREGLKKPIRGGGLPQPRGPDEGVKSFGQLFTESKEFKDSVRSHSEIPVELDIGLKTLFETTAGFAPESIRTGRVVEAVTRPVQVLDLIPSAPMNQAVEKYMEQTTRTHGAAEKGEGVAYAESTFVYTEKTSDVRKITDSIPVTDEQLEDEAQVRALLDQQLRFGLRQRLDLQVLVGNGTAPNLRGINNVSGIQTQAKGTDPTIAAFLRALTKVRVTGRANPNGAVFHPNDWQDILLTQNSNGDYLFGNPFNGPGPQSLFGIAVAQSDAQTENTGLVGDFANWCRIGERRGILVQIGYVGTQFTEGKVTLRADLRACFTVYRPAAFCTLTSI